VRITIEVQRAASVIRLIDTIVVDAIRFRPEQRIVPVIHECHGQTELKWVIPESSQPCVQRLAAEPPLTSASTSGGAALARTPAPT
jgi:hypothetical protein